MALPSTLTKAEHYQVAIVGGGIAGLTLALEFERLGVKYALFESHDSLAPDEGASLGLQPNGLRILDQLGAFNEIAQHTAPILDRHLLDDQGKLLTSIGDRRCYVSKLVECSFLFSDVLDPFSNLLLENRLRVRFSRASKGLGGYGESAKDQAWTSEDFVSGHVFA